MKTKFNWRDINLTFQRVGGEEGTEDRCFRGAWGLGVVHRIDKTRDTEGVRKQDKFWRDNVSSGYQRENVGGLP